jgi:hypothetical protein
MNDISVINQCLFRTPLSLLLGTLLTFLLLVPAESLQAQATPAWTFCANEGGFCSFSGTRQVRYGANAKFVSKNVTAQNGGVACTNAVFGDPIVGTVKRCEVDGSSTPVLTPVIASFTANPSSIAPGNAVTLRWGVSNATRISIDNGIGTVNGEQITITPNATTTYTLRARNSVGSVTRSVEVRVESLPPPVSLPTIASFAAAPASIVSGNSSTLSWTVTGANAISIAPGPALAAGSSLVVTPTQTTTYTLTAVNSQGAVTRTTTIAVNTTPPPDHSGMGPYIDRSKIPTGSSGHSTERVQSTSDRPRASDGTGAFRTMCAFTHMNFDDPLVYPGQPGAAHLHVFFGNAAVNANSNELSIATSGNSSCRGGIANRTAYWVPALIDTRDGTPLKPLESHFYYKTGYNGIAPSAVQPIPIGLRMIAGDAKASGSQGRITRWKCINNYQLNGSSIQNCPVGDELWQEIFFPQCWNGRDLDSPDHKSHMAYPSGGRCPSTHPVPIPEITFNIRYAITEANAPQRWRLSSDMYPATQPGGYSSHGDWFNGWKQEIMDTFVRRCDQPALDCGSHMLGDGRAIY